MNWGLEKQKSGSECLKRLAGSLAPSQNWVLELGPEEQR